MSKKQMAKVINLLPTIRLTLFQLYVIVILKVFGEKKCNIVTKSVVGSALS
jgi:hypothetical protein